MDNRLKIIIIGSALVVAVFIGALIYSQNSQNSLNANTSSSISSEPLRSGQNIKIDDDVVFFGAKKDDIIFYYGKPDGTDVNSIYYNDSIQIDDERKLYFSFNGANGTLDKCYYTSMDNGQLITESNILKGSPEQIANDAKLAQDQLTQNQLQKNISDELFGVKDTWDRLDTDIVHYGSKEADIIKYYGTPAGTKLNAIFYNLPLLQPLGSQIFLCFDNQGLLNRVYYTKPADKGNITTEEYYLNGNPQEVAAQNAAKQLADSAANSIQVLRNSSKITMAKVNSLINLTSLEAIQKVLGNSQTSLDINPVNIGYYMKDGSNVYFLRLSTCILCKATNPDGTNLHEIFRSK